MNKKLTQTQLCVVSVFALLLSVTSPALAQCSGGVCRVPAQTSYAVRTTSYNCSYNCSYNSCGTFAPFGGFFRNLFGGCGYQCAAQNGGACFSRLSGAAEPKGQFSRECSGATCLADPVGRESAPDVTTDEEFATEEPEPGTDAALSAVVEKLQTEQCEESDNCEPCGAVRATWLEKKLFDCANAQRRANGLRPFLFDGRLIQWARFNSSLQARYCRVGHFSGYGAEIAGEGYTTPEAAVQGWLGSAPHRVILLDGGYTRCGCACYQGANGRYYWTMSFGN